MKIKQREEGVSFASKVTSKTQCIFAPIGIKKKKVRLLGVN